MARDFDGSNNISASVQLVTGPPITAVCWFKSDLSSTGPLITLPDTSTNNQFIQLRTHKAGSLQCQIRTASGGSTAATTTSYSAGSWHHGAFVAAATDDRAVWLDGGGKGTNGANRVMNTPTDVNIASWQTSSGFMQGFKGAMAEVAIWDVALTEAEIQSLAAGLSPLALTHRLGNLVCFQDLIRDINRPGVGPQLTNSGSTVVSHPRVYYAKRRLFVPSISTNGSGGPPGNGLGAHHVLNLGQNLFKDPALLSSGNWSLKKASYNAATEKLTEDTSDDKHIIFQPFTSSEVSDTATLQCWAKAGERNIIFLSSKENNKFHSAFFDLTAGQVLTIGASGPTSAAIFDASAEFGTGWYHCVARFDGTYTDADTVGAIGLAEVDNDTNYLGNGTSGAFIKRAQLHRGATELPWFDGGDRSQVTDQEGTNDAAITGVDLYNPDYGLFDGGDWLSYPDFAQDLDSFSIQALVDHDGTASDRTVASHWNEATNNRSWVMLVDAADKLTVKLSSNGSSVTKSYTANTVLNANEQYLLSATYDGASDALLLYVNGSAVTDVTKTTDNAMTSAFDAASEFRIGAEGDGQRSYQGKIYQSWLYEQVLTATEIETIASDLGLFEEPQTSNALLLAKHSFKLGRNLLKDPASLDSTNWILKQATYNATTEKLTESTVDDSHIIYQSFTPAEVTDTATIQCWAKAGERNIIFLSSKQNNQFHSAFFDLTAGAVLSVGANGPTAAEIHDASAEFGAGWYRCVACFDGTYTDQDTVGAIGVTNADNSTSYAGDGTSGVFIKRAQVHRGARPLDWYDGGDRSTLADTTGQHDAAVNSVDLNATTYGTFNGGHLEVSDASFQNVSAFTLQAQIVPASSASDQAIMSHWDETAGQRAWSMLIDAAGKFTVKLSSDGVNVTKSYASNAVIPTGKSTLLSATYDGPTDRLRLFVDGVELGDNDLTKTVDNSMSSVHAATIGLTIGAEGDSQSGFAGNVQNTWIYDAARAPGEIQGEAQKLALLGADVRTLVAHHPMELGKNLLINSQDLSKPEWNTNAATFSIGKITETAVLDRHYVVQPMDATLIGTADMVVRCSAKADGRDWIWVGAKSDLADLTDYAAFFNLATGTKGFVGANVKSASIIDDPIDPGYKLCEIRFDATKPFPFGGNPYFGLAVDDNTDEQAYRYIGDVTKGVFISKAQVYQSADDIPYYDAVDRSQVFDRSGWACGPLPASIHDSIFFSKPDYAEIAQGTLQFVRPAFNKQAFSAKVHMMKTSAATQAEAMTVFSVGGIGQEEDGYFNAWMIRLISEESTPGQWDWKFQVWISGSREEQFSKEYTVDMPIAINQEYILGFEFLGGDPDNPTGSPDSLKLFIDDVERTDVTITKDNFVGEVTTAASLATIANGFEGSSHFVGGRIYETWIYDEVIPTGPAPETYDEIKALVAPNGTLYVVDKRVGSNSNDGSEASPWETISHAGNQVTNANDAVLIRGSKQKSDRYYEKIPVSASGNNSNGDASKIWFYGDPVERPVVDGSMDFNGGWVSQGNGVYRKSYNIEHPDGGDADDFKKSLKVWGAGDGSGLMIDKHYYKENDEFAANETELDNMILDPFALPGTPEAEGFKDLYIWEAHQCIWNDVQLRKVQFRHDVFDLQPGECAFEYAGSASANNAKELRAAMSDTPTHVWVHLPDGSDPDDAANDMRVADLEDLLTGGGNNHIGLKNIDFRFSADKKKGGGVRITGNNWKIENCTFNEMACMGLYLAGNDHVVYNCHASYNGQLGIRVITNDRSVLERIYLEHNNYNGWDAAWEAGGIKVSTTGDNNGSSGSNGVSFKAIYARDNGGGPGVWFDIDNFDWLVEDSLFIGNGKGGVMVELNSKFGTLINSVLCYQELSDDGKHRQNLGPGIRIQSASENTYEDLTVYRNAGKGCYMKGDDHRAANNKNTVENCLFIQNGTGGNDVEFGAYEFFIGDDTSGAGNDPNTNTFIDNVYQAHANADNLWKHQNEGPSDGTSDINTWHNWTGESTDTVAGASETILTDINSEYGFMPVGNYVGKGANITHPKDLDTYYDPWANERNS